MGQNLQSLLPKTISNGIFPKRWHKILSLWPLIQCFWPTKPSLLRRYVPRFRVSVSFVSEVCGKSTCTAVHGICCASEAREARSPQNARGLDFTPPKKKKLYKQWRLLVYSSHHHESCLFSKISKVHHQVLLGSQLQVISQGNVHELVGGDRLWYHWRR